MDEERVGRLSLLFKALADPARLRILGALAERPFSGRELSERLGLTPPTISHHMARLADAGLVRVSAQGQRRDYSLDLAALQTLGRGGEQGETSPPTHGSEASPASAADRERAKVLRDFFVDGRLKQIPAQRRKRVVVLQQLVTRFAPDHDYPEREVNGRLREAHDDVATLRRELVDYGFMTRASGVYRVAAALPPRGPTVAQEIVGDEQSWLRTLIDGATARALNAPSDPACTLTNTGP